jgi:pyochelin synthetase
MELEHKSSGLTPEKRALVALRLSRARRHCISQKVISPSQVHPDPRNRYEPFPLSDIQQAYLIGRSDGAELGNISCQSYSEVEVVDWDHERFEAALQKIIERHEMLRCVVLPEGRQQILPQVASYRVESIDLRGQGPMAAAARLEAVRQQMSQQVRPTDRWPLFDFRVSHLDSRRSRLHVSVDLLIADGRSLQILFGELAQLYNNPDATLPPIELSFRDYLLAFNSLEDTEAHRESTEYWLKRSPTLPPAPELPLVTNPASITRPRFKRRQARIDATLWRTLKERSARLRLTPAGTLLAAYAEVLGIWSKNPRFTINLTLFNRLPLHPQANAIIGDFTSVDLLEIDNSKPEAFEARARRVQEQLWQDLDHRYFSGIQVIRELSRSQRGGPKAIMPVVFTSLLNIGDRNEEPIGAGQLGKIVFAITQTPQVYLDFMVHEERDELVINWDAVDDLFPLGLLDDLFNAYRCLVEQLASDDASWQRTFAENSRRLIPVTQMDLREEVNDTGAPVTDELLHTLFLKQVEQHPDQTAVCASTRRLSYAEVYQRACRVEEQLLHRGVQPNQLVAVMMEKGWEQVVAVLGIHFAGGAYLPIDPELPAERQCHLVEHGEVKVVLTQSAVRHRLRVPAGVDVLAVDLLSPGDAGAPVPRRRQKPEDLAYVIYTSGSTGLPKGVMIDHRGAVNTVLDINRRFGIGSQDRVLAISRLSFDLSVYDIFGVLAAGGTIVMPSAELAHDPAHWAELILSEKVTVWNTVPALMQLLVEQAARPEAIGDSLRLIMMSGDWIPLNLPVQIRRILSNTKIVSLGGATEASIWSILYPIERVDPNWKSIPYGKPMLNQTFHVLNQMQAPCPIGVPGQLYIGGIGLAKGYWRDEQKTKASFIQDSATGQRLYRTGDWGRYLPDGNIEFLGREDFQVKLNGYRVELGEIEVRLQEHDGVENCVVAVREDSPGEKRLVAYATAKPGVRLEATDLQEHLRARLPEYMVPSVFVFLDRFPLTPNGKVDRRALPAPAQNGPTMESAPTAPRDALELQLTNILERILRIRPVGLRDNFFDLGGQSLIAVRLFSELRELTGRNLPLSAFFQAPTVEKLANLLRADG